MKNRITQLFETKQKNILSIFFTAGHPNLNDAVPIIKTLEASGADLIEVGMPFSDPIADGPTIQRTSEKALINGMSLNVLFDQLKDIRKETKLPLILMGYMTPVFKYGMESFLAKCKEIGIDGLILPELPLEVYEEEFSALFDKYGLYNIFLITPQTSEARIRKIDTASKAFIYMVSSASTTGAKTSIASEQEAYFKRIQAMKLKNPYLIGFGISNKETFQNACKYASGAIIGSAFVKALEEDGNVEDNTRNFINSLI